MVVSPRGPVPTRGKEGICVDTEAFDSAADQAKSTCVSQCTKSVAGNDYRPNYGT